MNTAVCYSGELSTRYAAPKGTSVREEKREKTRWRKGEGASLYIVGREEAFPFA